MFRRCFALLICGCCVLQASSAKKTIGVLPLSVDADLRSRWAEDDRNMGKGIADKITAAVEKLPRFTVAESNVLLKWLSDNEISETDRLIDSLVYEAGAAAQCDLIIYGAISMYSVAWKNAEVKGQSGKYVSKMAVQIRYLDPVAREVKKNEQVDLSGSGESRSDARFNTINNLAKRMSSTVETIFPLEATITKAGGNEIEIGIGSEMGLHKGDYIKSMRGGEKTAVFKIVGSSPNSARAKLKKQFGDYAMGDKIAETKAKTNLMLSFGYSMSMGQSNLQNSVPDIIFPIYAPSYSDTMKDTISPDLSKHKELGNLMGIQFSLEFHQIKYSNVFTGFHFAFQNQDDYFKNFTFDWRMGYEFPLIEDRLWIPLGAGLGFGRYSYDIDYVLQLRSQNESLPISEDYTETSNTISAFNFGFVGFSGLNIKIYKALGLNILAGYRYHLPIDSWDGTYSETHWEWDSYDSDNDGDYWEEVKEETEFELDQDNLPHKDVLLNGLDIRAGIYVMF